MKILLIILLLCPLCLAETADQWNSVYVLGSYCLTDMYMAFGAKPVVAASLTILSSTCKEVADRFYQANPRYWNRGMDRIFDRRGFDYQDIIRSAVGATLKLVVHKIDISLSPNRVNLTIRF